MNLDTLLRIGIDAAAAFAVVNIVNVLRQGWIWPRIKIWLNQPQDKPARQGRIISLAWWVSVIVAAVFALRMGWADWQQFAGERASRAIICWLLSLGQFDVIRLAWPRAFDPNHEDNKEVIIDDSD